MHKNSPIEDNSPSMQDLVQAMINLINEKSDWKEVKYKICEYFPPDDDIDNYKAVKYNLISLKMGQEDGQVFCSDLDGILPNYKHTLTGFLVEDIIYIGFHEDHIVISFADGYITIKY